MRSSPPFLHRLCGALLALLLPLAAPASSARAQVGTSAPTAGAALPDVGAEAGSELTVYLVTMGPGDAVWEKFGHNAIWIRDAAQNTDVAYNWGVFDFNEADFIPRFLKGSMRYWLAPYPAGPMIEAYQRMNRSVWVQELALTPAQRRELRDFVEWNAQPGNAHYHYNYFLDNCSTRVRDALDRVLGGRLRAALDTVPTGTTFRWHTRRLSQGELPIYTGMNLVLGQPGDRPITAWEETFLPMKLRDRVQALTVAGPDGAPRPLVVREQQLFTAQRAPEPAAPANLIPGYLTLGVVFGGLLAWLARAAAQGSRAAATAFGVAGTLWSLLATFAGVVMLLTWTATDHTFMYRNENLLQLSPLSLALVVLLPRFALRGHAPNATWMVSAAVALLALLGALLQPLPLFEQVNGEIVALALPVHLGLAWGVRRLRHEPAPAHRSSGVLRAGA